jgi:hypothetical protein
VGAAVQKAAGAPPGSPRGAEAIIAPQLQELRARGYADEEIAEARKAYSKYFDRYEYVWNEFLKASPATFDKLDDDLERQLAAIEARHQAAKGATK